MSGVLSTVGKIAGVVSAVAMVIPGAQPIAAAAALVATAASIGAQLTAVPPPRQGSVSQTTIGSDQPSPWIVGRTYYGGSRVQLVGYGATLKKVKNPYLLAADVHSVGGPVDGLEAIYADLAVVPVQNGVVANANGYFRDHLWRSYQLGQQTEASALALRFGGAPGWAADARLSGKAAIAYNALFDRDGEVFASGFSPMGAVWRGARCWNPVEDSTYPGGVGASRWAPPSDTAGHDAARATWAFTRSPGLLALRYALGIYERDTRNAASRYRKTFGAGIPIDGLIVEQFVHLHNVCAANNWHCDGILFEPSSSKWDNLKRILAAGGAEPCWIGGRLGVRVNAPRIAVDTITASDLADGEIVVGAMQGWEQRLNTIVPKYRSEAHRWEYVATDPVQIATYLVEDGEEKREERQYDLVQDPAQARQLAAYELLDRRELGEIELPCKPRLRRYGPGDLLTVNLPDAGLVNQPAVVLRRSLDPATMGVTLVLRGETMAKHDFALGRTGTPPPTPALVATPSLDEIWLERPVAWDTISDPIGTKPEDNATVGAPDGTNVGDRPVTDVLAAIDAAKARHDQLDNVTIPTINKAVDDADDRITFVRGLADDAFDRAERAITDADTVNRRVDRLIAEGGGGSDAIDSVARAEIKRVDEAAISREGAITRSIDEFEAGYESGAGNLLTNTDFPTDDLAGWRAEAYLIPIAAFHRDLAGDTWHPIGESVLGIRQIGGVGGGPAYADAASDNFAVGGGTFIQFYHFAASHRCDTQLWVNFYDMSGSYITSAGGTIAERRTGGRSPANWARNGRVCEQVPANAVTARLFMRKLDTDEGEFDSYAWFWRPYVGPARQGQTSWNPYSPGNGKAVAQAVNSRVSREVTTLAEADAALARETKDVEARLNGNITASARDVTTAFTNADRALASRAVNLETAAIAARAGSLVANDTFSFWSDPSATPNNWGTWNQPLQMERVPPSGASAGWVLRATVAKGYETGLWQTPCRFEPGWFVMEIDAELRDGTWEGLGATVEGFFSLDAAREPDINEVISPYGFKRRRWSKLFYCDRALNNWHLMMNWVPFGPMEYKQVDWFHCGVRPASAQEIASRKAIDVTIPAVAARVKTTEDVLADLPHRYAAASRTDQLEAQVNFGTDSGLKRTLLSQIEDRATAIADAKAGVVARDVSTLRGEYDGTKGEVSRQAGVMVDLQGKASAYVKLIADAGNGRAALSLWSDQFGGAWQLTGNGAIDGNLTINGTLTARAFNGASMAREVSASWSGNVQPAEGQTVTVPWSLTVPTIPPTGRFIYEYRLSVVSNANTSQFNGNDSRGRPVTTHYVDDGGVVVRATDPQGNRYSPRANSSERVLAQQDFSPTFTATVTRGSQHTTVDDGDYVNIFVSAYYQVTLIDLKVTWVAI
ncbi:hypothetical protein [uncultured Sphingomonas sp.]|uniref:hypothetical protein n=1 Tax=uncultured Sphingomonas sp. TaxID=158754 RepID=UPI0025F75092|nr:hypothetical protein [uncultured Sphingomonas sp.]